MTDNEIRQALLCHESWGIDSCDSCPLTPGKACGMQLARETLELINRQKAGIEALIEGQETLQKYMAKARSEAIKEFAERLKEEGCFYSSMEAFESIDSLVKEMTEGTT